MPEEVSITQSTTPVVPPIIVVTPPAQAEPAEPEVNVETLIPTGDYRTDPTFYAIADYFNVPTEDYPIAKDYLGEIVEYVIRDTKSNDTPTILKKIREIEDQVQTPQWGEKRYWNIRKYIRLASRKSDIEKAMGAVTKKE